MKFKFNINLSKQCEGHKKFVKRSETTDCSKSFVLVCRLKSPVAVWIVTECPDLLRSTLKKSKASTSLAHLNVGASRCYFIYMEKHTSSPFSGENVSSV